VVEEVGEGRRGQEHAGEVGQALVLIHKSTVLRTQVSVLVDLGSNLALKLSDVF
jgi:hypothetical protein